MLLPISWLNEFIDLPSEWNCDKIVEAFINHSAEVENVIDKSKGILNVVIGQILSIEKHPDADQLVVCQVNTGKEKIQIVTGAKNITLNDRVPIALDGAELPTGMKIKSSKLRGVPSQGMMCSEKELGLADDAQGILILEANAPLGVSICEYLKLNQPIIDLSILPNRGDLMSIKGLARELSVITKLPLKDIEVYTGNETATLLPIDISIADTVLCKRYIGTTIKGIKIKPSPAWIQDYLKQSNIKPINNIVDITNFVMLELGQPLHAFDYKQIKNHQIVVRKANENETMTLLNDELFNLSQDHLVISDEEKPVALAGIMGGKFSAIESDTQDIILESAFFSPVNVRRTAFSLGLRTESSQRFEKGVDYETVELAMRRAIYLVLKYAGGTVASPIIDVNSGKADNIIVPFKPEIINRLLGTDISRETMVQILTLLGFTVKNNQVTVPSFRRDDVYREADIAEEVGRFYGFNNIVPTLPVISDFSDNCKPFSRFELCNQTRNLLTSIGASEIISYTMISPDENRYIYNKQTLSIKNPLSHDESVLRPNIFVSVIKNAELNSKNLVQDLKTFEIGNVFYIENEKIVQSLQCGAIFIGKKDDHYYSKAETEMDFFDIKGIVEDLLRNLGIKKVSYDTNQNYSFFHPYRSSEAKVGKDTIAIFGEVHPSVKKEYSLIHYPNIFQQKKAIVLSLYTL